MKLWVGSIVGIMAMVAWVATASNAPVYTGPTLFYIEQAQAYTADLTAFGGLWDDVTPVSSLFFNLFWYTPYSGLTILGPVQGTPALGFYPPQIVPTYFAGTGRFIILDEELNKTLVRFAYCLYGVGGLPPNDIDCDGIVDDQDPDDDNDGIEDWQDPNPGGGGASNGGGSTAWTATAWTATAGTATAWTATAGTATAWTATAGTATAGTATAWTATAGTATAWTATAWTATAGTATAWTATAWTATAGTATAWTATAGTATAGTATAGTATAWTATAGTATAGTATAWTATAWNPTSWNPPATAGGSTAWATNGTDKNRGDLRIEIPYETKRDIVTKTDILTPSQNDQSFYNLFRLANEWLWIIIGLVAFMVLLYGGFLLMTSKGDAKALKKAQDLILYAVLGIAIAIFAYLIVNVLVNLFS
jgi:hypothetical protein